MDPKKILLKKRKKFVLSEQTSLSTGSTLLNLACTDHPRCGLIPGQYYFLVGDSTSGKTWLTLTCFAESRLHPSFKDYELHFDEVENGALMDIEHYFGKKVAQDMHRHSSETIEDFYRRLHDLLIKQRKKIIYVLDSQDALNSSAALKKFSQQQVQAEAGQKVAGSYNDGKAKYHSENIRWVMSGLKRTGSILIIIGQTRDNLNAFGFADKKTRSGGKSLRFYANIEIWTSVAGKLSKKVRGKQRPVGIKALAEVRKNRITGKIGKSRAAIIPIYNSFGIDDPGSLVDFLISENYLPVKKRPDGSTAWSIPDVDFTGTRTEIIKFIEENDALSALQNMTAKVWKEIEDECQLTDRKRRYV